MCYALRVAFDLLWSYGVLETLRAVCRLSKVFFRKRKQKPWTALDFETQTASLLFKEDMDSQ